MPLAGVPLDTTAGVLIAGPLFRHTGFPGIEGAISDAAKSPVPSLGYAGTCTCPNVLLTFAGTLMMTV